MHPETRTKEEQLKAAGYDLEAAIERMRAQAPDVVDRTLDGKPVPIQTSLPSRLDEPRLVLDLVQLHDLVHAAALVYLDTIRGMRHHRRHEHANRIAHEAEAIARVSDYLERGDRRA